MSRNEILRRFPNACEDFIQRNLDRSDTVQNPIPKSPVLHEPARKNARKEGGAASVKVRIVSFRRRLLDADNLAGGSKFIIDALRYAGVIHNDSPDDIELSFEQVKVFSRSPEETLVMIQRDTFSAEEAAQIYGHTYREITNGLTNGNT